MNASLSWIKAYVPELETGYQEFSDAMTLSGTKVENFKVFDENLEKIVVGKILKIEKHPDADKLLICNVDVGTENLQIVTGADNIFEGALVPVVLAGGKVAGSHGSEGPVKIKPGKLRGVESYGMLCSIEELGATKDLYPEAPENGIYIFQEELEPGTDAVEVLGLHDANYEFEITSNRVDCYSVLGIAREAAATFGKKFTAPVPEVKKTEDDINKYLKVEVEAKDLCPRYTARMVKNIRIAPSPKWLRLRLASNGIRPINNIVDITNYVMEEYGQPMHAFNYDAISGGKIVVKRAKDGEKFVTLDGQERALDNDVLMICDAEKPIGIAGIMGGEDSKITDDVKMLVFESACFDGTNNRLSSKRLGLRTDASGKYEKGLDPENTLPAIERACQLIEMLDAGDVVGGTIDIYPEPVKTKHIKFEPDRINRFLGINISKEQQLSYFPPLEIKYDEKMEMLEIPSFRQDLLRGADIAEEVARFYGYANIPVTLPKSSAAYGKLSYNFVVDNKIRKMMTAYGYSESMTYSFESPKVFDKLLLDENDEKRNAVKISNPLGEDYSIMRTGLLNGMLTSLSTNYNRRNKDIALFELGNIYVPKALPLTELPDERMTLVIGTYAGQDFFDVKGLLEEIFESLGIKTKRTYKNEGKHNFLHPGRQADVYIKDKNVAFLGELHPVVAKNYAIGAKALIAQVDVKALYELANFSRKFKEVPKYPAVQRDLSMVVNKDTLAGDIELIIEKNGGNLLEEVDLFDVYEGDQIEKGYKSLAFTVVFRAKDKTLEEAEINSYMNKIIEKLKEKGIELRG